MTFIKSVGPAKLKFLGSGPESSHEYAYVYKNARGEFLLFEEGNRLSYSEYRRHKSTVEYCVLRKTKTISQKKIKLRSRNGIDDFDAEMTCDVRVKDPVAYVKSDIDQALESNLTNRVLQTMRQAAREYEVEDFGGLDETIQERLQNMTEFKEAGLALSFTVLVEISEEIRQKIKRRKDEWEEGEHERRKKERQRQWEKEDREADFEEFRKLLAGTPGEGMLIMFKSVDELRANLLTEYKGKRETIDALWQKYARGDIDEVQWERARRMLNINDTMLSNYTASARLQSEEKASTPLNAGAESAEDKADEDGLAFKASSSNKTTDEGWD